MAHNDDGQAGQGRRLAVVVLCGLIGSGKSTCAFANAAPLLRCSSRMFTPTVAKAVEQFHPEYVRCNQDQLGSRNAVKELAMHSLSAGKSVVIDRTNVDESQRSTWVDVGRSFPGVELQAVVFQTPLEICKARLALRTDHETIRDPAHAIDVLQRFYRHFAPPVHAEGFERIVSVYPSDFASEAPTQAETDAILARIAQSPQVRVPLVRRPEAGGLSRGGRGASRRGAPRSSRGPYHGNHRGRGTWPPLQQQQPRRSDLPGLPPLPPSQPPPPPM